MAGPSGVGANRPVVRASAPPQAALGRDSKCPICDQEFKRAFSVKRHIKQKHPKEEANVSHLVATTKKQFPHCNMWKSNIWEHMRTCKSKTVHTLVVEPIVDTRDPISFNPGGRNIIKSFDEWLDKIGCKTKNTRDLGEGLVQIFKQIVWSLLCQVRSRCRSLL